MFDTKIVSVESVGSYISLDFDENLNLKLNRPTKIVVCAPGLSNDATDIELEVDKKLF